MYTDVYWSRAGCIVPYTGKTLKSRDFRPASVAPGNRRTPPSCHRHPMGRSTEAPLAARHALLSEQELCLLCQLLRQLLGLSVAKVNSDFLHYGKGLRVHSQAWLGSGCDGFGLRSIGETVEERSHDLGATGMMYTRKNSLHHGASSRCIAS